MGWIFPITAWWPRAMELRVASATASATVSWQYCPADDLPPDHSQSDLLWNVNLWVQRSSNYFPPWRDTVKWLKWKLLKEELFLQNICRRLTFSMPVLGTLLTLRVNASPGRYSSKTLFASVSLLKSVTQRPSKKEHHFINNCEKIIYKRII